jgi:hypothetical protein
MNRLPRRNPRNDGHPTVVKIVAVENLQEPQESTGYLVLLGIAQTCRFQEKSFLKFLLSKEIDVDRFQYSKRIKISKPINREPRL